MNISSLTAPAVNATSSTWTSRGLVRRMWEGDPTVWSDDPDVPELADRLGWLRLHETTRAAVDEILSVAGDVADDSDHVVLCGMGGSSLAPEVFSEVIGSTEGHPELLVLDSTHPAAVREIRDAIDPSRTTFVISSKSGTTLETLSFFRYFWSEADGDGSRFVAVTDPGSKLATLGRDRGFRAVFEADPEVGGRFSALTHFGLVPAAFIGIDIEALLDSAAHLAGSASDTVRDDPAVGIGIALAEAAKQGIDKLTILTSPSLSAFPAWMEQLVAESLGKDGTGIVPIADEPVGPPHVYGRDRVFLSYQLAGEHAPDLDELAEAGFPVIGFELPDVAALGREMLRAQAFTAVAGAVLDVHPFNQPNVEAAKNFARDAMSGELDLGGVRKLSGEDAIDAVTALVRAADEGGYLGLHAYLPPDDDVWAAMTRLRIAIRAASGAATTCGWGPRFLHSTGQLHKGGPPGGRFVQFVDSADSDVAVPETDMTFGQIIAAQAAGDHEALVEANRPVVQVDVGRDVVDLLEQLTEAVS